MHLKSKMHLELSLKSVSQLSAAQPQCKPAPSFRRPAPSRAIFQRIKHRKSPTGEA
jgi:hypothetical protein